MNAEPTPSRFSLGNFQTLVAGIELLYLTGRRLSDAIGNQRCEYLIQEASMAFVKTMMSVFGFLRFIPASLLLRIGRLHEGERSSFALWSREGPVTHSDLDAAATDEFGLAVLKGGNGQNLLLREISHFKHDCESPN